MDYNYITPTDEYQLRDGVLYRKVLTTFRKVQNQTSTHAKQIISELTK